MEDNSLKKQFEIIERIFFGQLVACEQYLYTSIRDQEEEKFKNI